MNAIVKTDKVPGTLVTDTLHCGHCDKEMVYQDFHTETGYQHKCHDCHIEAVMAIPYPNTFFSQEVGKYEDID